MSSPRPSSLGLFRKKIRRRCRMSRVQTLPRLVPDARKAIQKSPCACASHSVSAIKQQNVSSFCYLLLSCRLFICLVAFLSGLRLRSKRRYLMHFSSTTVTNVTKQLRVLKTDLMKIFCKQKHLRFSFAEIEKGKENRKRNCACWSTQLSIHT